MISRRKFFAAAAAVTLCGPERFSALQSADPYALILGIAQDSGMPQVGCYTDQCERARNRERPRYAASMALVYPGRDRYYLVDATPDITRQLDLLDEPRFRARANQRRPFDGIFLTHAHIGHYIGLAVLGREGLGMAPTPTYCTPEMADFLTNNGPWGLMAAHSTARRISFCTADQLILEKHSMLVNELRQ